MTVFYEWGRWVSSAREAPSWGKRSGLDLRIA
jgi:hypothetical protein